MARTSEQLSQLEVDAFNRFCNEHRIVCDDSNAGHANGNLMGDYIVFSWKENITQETLAVALSKLRDRLVFYSDSEWAYKKIADEDSVRAQTLNQWFESSSNSALVSSGEEGLKNQSALLAELKGREITPQTIQDAIGRAGYKHGLHYATDRIPRPADPRQHADDGKGMFSKDDTNLSPRDHARLAKEAADKAAGRSAPTAGTDFRALAEAVKGKTHSQTDQIQKMFVTRTGTSEIDYEQTWLRRRKVAGL
jgi:hypothetical protein